MSKIVIGDLAEMVELDERQLDKIRGGKYGYIFSDETLKKLGMGCLATERAMEDLKPPTDPVVLY